MENIFKDITSLNLNNANELTVCLASVNNDKLEYQRLQLTDDLMNDFKENIKNLLCQYKKILENNNLIIHRHDEGTKLNGYDIEYLDLTKCDFVKTQINDLLPANKKKIFKFKDNNDFISSLKFYVISIKFKTRMLNFFRIYSPKKELERSKIFAIFFEKGQFNKIRKPTFLFDYKIDCISENNDIFIFNKSNFYNMFRYYDLIKKLSSNTLEVIKSLNLINNFDELKKSCDSHLQMQLKLSSISAKPYLSKLNIDEIKKLNNKCKLNLEIKYDKIVFDKNKKWEILRLLDDGYLRSLLTQLLYETDNKRPLNLK
jgi:hypothetical protein